jgi:hypothetical protein
MVFWNDDTSTGSQSENNMPSDDNSCSTTTTSNCHGRTSVPIQDDIEQEDDVEVTTEDYDNVDATTVVNDDAEEEMYIFCDSSCTSSEVSAQVMTKKSSHDDEINHHDGCASIKDEVFHVSSILGTSLIRHQHENSTETEAVYSTDLALQNSALVGLYFAKASECQQTTEYVNLFTSGYYHPSFDTVCNDIDDVQPRNEFQALTIVFCRADDGNGETNGIVNDAPINLPCSWYTIPMSEQIGAIKRRIMKAFDIVTTAGPTLVIFDPVSGHIVSSNAILDIIHLDRSDFDRYDREACELYDSWLQQLLSMNLPSNEKNSTGTPIRYEQMDIDADDHGLVMIEYIDGKRSSYERSLPYSI